MRQPSDRSSTSWPGPNLLAVVAAAAFMAVFVLGTPSSWGREPEAFDAGAVRLSPPGAVYIDPEVLQVGAKLVFQTGGGEIWLADLDPDTGLFVSPDGKNELVDSGAYPIAVTWSGPELGVDASGWSVFYAKAEPPGGAPQIWRAEPTGDGFLTGPLTTGSPHQTQLATTSLTRTGTRVLNIRGDWSDGTIAWFSESDPDDERDVIEIDEDTFGRTPARWSRDGRFVLHRDGLGRVNLLDADLGATRLVTDDGSVHDDPNAWRAPELGGELLVATVMDDTRIAILRDLGGPTWTRIATLEVPAGSAQDYYGSPEPLVVGGRSYLSLVVKDQPNHSGTTATEGEVWIIGIEEGADGSPEFARRCDDGTAGVYRSDPETFIGTDEVFVYYSVIDGGPGGGAFYEAWRARTGIPADAPPRPEAAVEDGRLRGLTIDGADAFRGIPFAAPPTGANRWRPPQPVEAWPGVRDAAFFGDPAPQTLASRVGGDPRVIGDEDCLTLNVWTPADRDPGDRLPVMVFIHGGGNMSGASSEPMDSIIDLSDGAGLYDGARLAAEGRVVVVTVNYRLGPLGYLALPALDAESAAAGGPGTSGNYGILDQVAALEWVERNIEAFGGDRHRVLLFGQSGGARNTAVHLASPLSRGLFSAAAMHSGVPSVRTRAEIDGFTEELLAELGLTGSEPDLLERLRAVDPAAFVTADAAQPIGLGLMRYGPHVDGFVLPDQPTNVINRGEHAAVPFVIGSNSAEYAHRFAGIPDDEYEATVIGMLGALVGAQVLARYPLSDFGSAGEAVDAINTDKNLTCTVRRTAGWVASNQAAPVFRYWFDHTLSSPLRLGDGAYHTSELLLLYQHVSAGHLDGDAADLAVEAFMLDAWARLAAAGSPDVAWHQPWPAYQPGAAPAMRLGPVPAVEHGIRSERCDFWDRLARSASRPPELDLPGAPVVVAAGRRVDLLLRADDADGDDVDFAVSGLPTGAELDPETGRLRWRPSPEDVGTHVLAVTATDVWGATDSGTLTLEVSDGLPPPRPGGGRRP
jgi:para-nitrobenzyl esterase